MSSTTTNLHQLLKTLCSNSVWNYAVFWKLKHRSRMVLTCEDAYYENCEQNNLSESKCFSETAENFHIGHYLHEPLGLVVENMSDRMYSLGEGIVGQVAVTQNHQRSFADETGSCSSFQSADGWESQFSAGIKTILVVSVLPHGVLQLGSLNKVTEDAKLVTQVREAFFTLQDSSIGHPICRPNLHAEVFPDCLSYIDKAIEIEGSNVSSTPPFPYFNQHNIFPTPFGVNDFPDVNSMNSYDNTLQYENFGVNNLYAPSSLLESVKLNTKDSSENGDSNKNPQAQKRKFENPMMLSHLDSSNTDLKFWAGCELHEALNQVFSKRNIHSVWENEKIEDETNFEMTSGPTVSQLTFEPGSENLLEAVVANACHSSSSDVKSEISFSKSMKSLFTTDKIPEPSNEPPKNNKKKARHCEKSRPRPRDRQLIQDRLKELRELVPTGSKCSIDSLLERTIKHMTFLQNITKHADKLSKCAEAKTHKKRTGILRSSDYEQGSSWAVEVGGHLKVCSIVVENLNKKGQMLVEMVCEECSNFLELADTIRSLGLSILKALTEAQGDKMWICFVVEGQNNKVIPRMDILWSLVQILQSKSSI